MPAPGHPKPNGKPNGDTRHRPFLHSNPAYRHNRGLDQAYQLRDLTADEAITLAKTPANSLAERIARAKALQSLASVWSDASDRIRILKGKGLPKPVESKRKPKARAWLPPES